MPPSFSTIPPTPLSAFQIKLLVATPVATGGRVRVDPRQAVHHAAKAPEDASADSTNLTELDSTNLPPDCTFADQYAVYGPGGDQAEGCARCWQVAYGVLCANEMSNHDSQNKKETSSLLGKSGHVERFSAWSHWIGAIVFAIYAVVRSLVFDSESTAGQLATAAVVAIVFTLSSSGFYHSTAPDMEISTWSRWLDYASIYVGIVITSVADIAVSTKGFIEVPAQTVVDIPIAGSVMVLFFLWRRWMTGPEETWAIDSKRSFTGCSLGMGLFRRQHLDLHHAQLRYATSYLLAAGYFTYIPAAFASFEAGHAAVIVSLQAAGFLVLSLGMMIDRVLTWPDAPLARGGASAMQCKPCGCVANAHGLWHIVALVSISTTVVAREYGIAVS